MHAVASASGPSGLRGRYREILLVILFIAGLVLLIACTNIGNLLLARGDARRHEISVRLAVGASRGRLVRQLLIESGLVSLAGAALGALVAMWSSRLLVTQFSTSSDRVSLSLPLDWRVLGFATAAAVVTALVFGLLPTLAATRVEPIVAMADGRRAAVQGPRRWSPGSVLVVVQVALSLVLGVGASLLTVARERVVAILSGFFGALGFVLAGAGIYGATAYRVGCRRSEIAVRRALGASGARVAGLIVGRGMAIVLCGVVVGTLLSLWLAPRLEFLLYGIPARDPGAIRSAVAVLTGVALLATSLPVIGALRLDPARVLRES